MGNSQDTTMAWFQERKSNLYAVTQPLCVTTQLCRAYTQPQWYSAQLLCTTQSTPMYQRSTTLHHPINPNVIALNHSASPNQPQWYSAQLLCTSARPQCNAVQPLCVTLPTTLHLRPIPSRRRSATLHRILTTGKYLITSRALLTGPGAEAHPICHKTQLPTSPT